MRDEGGNVLVYSAQLPARRVDPGIGAIAVRHQDAGKALAQRRLGRRRVARGGGQEHGYGAGHHQPQPVSAAAFLVAGFVGVRDVLERRTDLGLA